jgi:integrase
MATVRKRTWSSGGETKTAWQATHTDQTGARRSKQFDRKRDADAWLLTVRDEVKRGVHTPESTSITVVEAAKLWLDKSELDRLERSTLQQYRNHVRLHIVPLIGTQRLARLTTPAIEAYCDALRKDCSPVMARKVLASVKAILGEAQRRGLVAQNAAQPVRVDVNRREQGKLTVGREIPSKEELNIILEKVAGRWRPLLITAIFTGMRSSELRGLAWNDVDFGAPGDPRPPAGRCLGQDGRAEVSGGRSRDPDGADDDLSRVAEATHLCIARGEKSIRRPKRRAKKWPTPIPRKGSCMPGLRRRNRNIRFS